MEEMRGKNEKISRRPCTFTLTFNQHQKTLSINLDMKDTAVLERRESPELSPIEIAGFPLSQPLNVPIEDQIASIRTFQQDLDYRWTH